MCTKVTRYTTYELRCFGPFSFAFGRGLFGLELRNALRRHADTLERRFRGLKIRTARANRLINGIALLSRWEKDGRVGQKDAILPNDCFPMGPNAFDKFKLVNDKPEDHGRPPDAMYMFLKMVRRQSRLFSAMYGGRGAYPTECAQSNVWAPFAQTALIPPPLPPSLRKPGGE